MGTIKETKTRKNQKRIYNWDQSQDPNNKEIMHFIQVHSLSTRTLIRNRLDSAFKFLYETHKIKPIKNYTQDELTSYIEFLQESKLRQQAKQAHFETFKKLLEYLGIALLKENTQIKFEENQPVWNSSERDPNKVSIETYFSQLRSKNTISRERRKLEFDITFLYSHFGRKYILEYNAGELKRLFLAINKKDVAMNEKMRYITALKNLIESITDMMQIENQPISQNYTIIFSTKFIRKIISEGRTKVMAKTWITAEELKEFYRKLININPYHYVLFRIFLSSCRVGGIVNLIIKNINWDYNCFQTQDKPTKASSGWNTYFFPEDFKSELRNYINQKGSNESQRLFPMSTHNVLMILKNYTDWQTRDFRRSMLYLWRLAGMDVVERNIFSNHESPRETRIDAVYSTGIELRNSSMKGKTDGLAHLNQIYQRFYRKIFY